MVTEEALKVMSFQVFTIGNVIIVKVLVLLNVGLSKMAANCGSPYV